MANKVDELDPLLEEVSTNLSNLIENINCLKETFGYSEGTLNQQLDKATKQFEEFIKPFKKADGDGDGELQIPSERIREYNKLEKKKNRARKALSLVPPSYIVTLVSLYDSFYAGLVRCIYAICPDKLQESNKEILYKDICGYESIKEVKKMLIDSIVEDLLRKSHVEQIAWLEKALGVETLKKFEGWSDFVELTERRNLFVHSDGMVSSQYISECIKHNVILKDIEIGGKLIADNVYFCNSYKLIYKMSIMMTQIMINKLYIGGIGAKTENADKIIINDIYELISEKQYDLAIYISKFAMSKAFHHTGKDRGFIILNLAQAYKWSGAMEECKKLLEDEDTSMWSNDLLLPKLCLEDNFEAVYEKMKLVGNTSEILTASAYREWPIFTNLRKEEKFVELFKEIFSEDLVSNQTINVADDLRIDDDTSTAS